MTAPFLPHDLQAAAPLPVAIDLSGRPTQDGKLVLTIFQDYSAQTALPLRGTFEQIIAEIRLSAPAKFLTGDQMPMLSFADYGDNRTEHRSLKHNGNVLCMYGVTGDYDGGRITIDEACARLRALNIKAALHTTRSNTPNEPRWRVLLPLATPVLPAAYPAMAERLDRIFGCALDPSSYKTAQGFFFGRVIGAPYSYLETGGTRCLDEIEGGDDPAPPGLTPYVPPYDSLAALEPVNDETMNAIEAAVMALPEQFWSAYDPWIYIGLALKSLVPVGQGPRALELWHRFSAQGNCYDHTETQRKWDSASPSAITYRSIFKLALDAGWKIPQATPRRRFTIIPASEYAAGKPPEWLIKGVLPKARLGVIFGAAGSGKSFIVMDIMANIHRGEPWRGHRVNKACVVYVAAEGAAGVKTRLKALAKSRGIAIPDIGIIADAPNLLLDEDAEGLIDTLCSYSADLIVIDTLAQSMPGGDENSSKDMGTLLEHARRIHERTGAMVLLIHHSGKDSTKGARGWSGLRGAADLEAEVTRDGENRALKITKLKDGNDGVAFGFKLKQVDLGQDDDGDPVSSCVIEQVDIEAPTRKPPGGKWQGPVYKAAMELTRNGKVPAARIIERVVSLVPHEPGTRDRRGESAKRALDELCLTGWLKADGDLIGHDY